MTTATPGDSLDQLAARLQTTVRHAVAAGADADLTAELGTMAGDIAPRIAPIEQLSAVLFDAPQLDLTDEAQSAIDQRREELRTLLATVRSQLDDDPRKVRRGTKWRDTRTAIDALLSTMLATRSTAYANLLKEFVDDDREQLQSLPHDTQHLDEYARAIAAFEHVLETMPESPAALTRAVATGQQLRSLRTEVESAAVPEAYRQQWRQLRGHGLPLAALSEEFRQWLNERNFADSVVLRLRH